MTENDNPLAGLADLDVVNGESVVAGNESDDTTDQNGDGSDDEVVAEREFQAQLEAEVNADFGSAERSDTPAEIAVQERRYSSARSRRRNRGR